LSSKFLLPTKITKAMIFLFTAGRFPKSLFLIDTYEHFLICLSRIFHTLSVAPRAFSKIEGFAFEVLIHVDLQGKTQLP
jgi:hypothetical protein